MRFIDTHSHIYDPVFDDDIAQTIERSIEQGVDTIILADVDSATRPLMLTLADRFPKQCLVTVGLHPTSVNDNPTSWREEVEAIESQIVAHPTKYVAIGECGMDLYWSKDFEPQQREAFIAQLELSLKYSLPVALHVRDAWGVTLEILQGYKGRGLRGVLHAFSGSVEMYHRVKECGDFLFGIGGVVTFKKASLADVVKEIPLSDLLLETDAPYLTPTPYRGKRNEPAYIPLIAQKIAELKGVTIEEVTDATTTNAIRMFSL